jgi:tRNA threonylcarbamoyladenosine biosynthesis protein TsaB
MISLFIDTSISFPTISLIRDNEVLYEFHEEIKNDMSSKILPIIDEGLKKSNLTLNLINNIFVVTGPGSFTGVRIGVTIAKTIAWSLNKKIVPISSLEFMATTSTNKDYVISMIDARRGNVFAGIYTNSLECIMKDTLIKLDELLKDKANNYELISYDNIENVCMPLPNIIKIINKHINDEGINPHELKPNYLKLTEAEEKRLLND